MDQQVPAQPDATDDASESEFHISTTTSLQERRPRTLKHGDTFAVFDQFGNVAAWPGNPEGLYHRDTRHLSRMELRLFGQRLVLLGSVVQDDNAALIVDLTNPDLYRGETRVIPGETLHVHRVKFLWEGAVHERISVFNYDDQPHRLGLSLLFDADFADLFEARGQRRRRHGERMATRLSDAEVMLRYFGLDDVPRLTLVRFWPRPQRLETNHAEYDLWLEPHQRLTIFVQVRCDEETPEPWNGRAFLLAMGGSKRALRRSSSRAASVFTSNDVFNEVVRRSISDLYMLMTDGEHGPYPYAGIPWFSTPFGRDAIITALFMLWVDPSVARGVLGLLAATQAREVDAFRDAEPGKILHEMRSGEMARLREVPFGLYYGSIDSTPLFVMLAGEYYRRTGDIATIRAIWPNIEAAIGWIDTHADCDGDGFVEYRRKRESGLFNQGWKDSNDAVFHADGRIAEGPIALCEVQGYVYAARRHAAQLARALGKAALAATLDDNAERLRLRFEEAFWCDDLGVYALALDGEKRPCRIVSSNAGQVLYSGIASPDRARRVAAALTGPRAFSGWGVRTIATDERRYNPMSYHNGSIWPHDNGMIALGFARYGIKEPVLRIFRGMVDAASYMELRRLPELFCGFSRKRRKGPTSYPVACSPQAWAAATPLALLQACLGLVLDRETLEIRLENPVLPDVVDELLLRNLSLGDASVDLHLRRYEEEVAVNVERRTGPVSVVASH